MAHEREAPGNVVRRERAAWRPFAFAVIGISLLVTTGAGVYATLSASVNNVVPQDIETGTLELAMSDNGIGFSQSISNLAPGDVVNRFVTLVNSGTLIGKDLTVATASTGTPSLITDGIAPVTTQALRVSVSRCSVAWTPATGICSGTTTPLLSSIALSAAASPQILLAGNITVSENFFLRISLTLPDQFETTVNGNQPANSIQGGAVNVTYTFTETQRSAETTNS